MSETATTISFKIRGLKGQLTRFENYLNNFNANPDYKVLATRLEKIELCLLTDFDNCQLQLQILDPEADYDSDRNEFEDRFYTAISRARSILDDNSSIGNILNQSINQNIHKDLHAIRLPPINLPTFDGSFDAFLHFFDTFKGIIHDSKTLTPTQKFHYLQSSLKGEALQTIQSIQVSDQNYFIAWNLICERYKNERIIVNSHIKDIFEIPSLGRESRDGLRRLLDTLQRNIRSLEALGQSVNSWDAILIYLMNSKLDNTTCREWESSIKGSSLPSLHDFIDFLNKKCQTLETLHFNKKPVTPQLPSGRVVSHVSPVNAKCNFCNGTHWLNQCQKFLNLSPNNRLQEVKKLHLCTNCLRTNHTYKDCKSGDCKKCNNRHHTLLHFQRQNVAQLDRSLTTATEPSANSEISTGACNYAQAETSHDTVVTTISNKNNYSNVLLSTANIYIDNQNNKPFLCRVLLDSGSQSNYITYELARKLNLELNKINLPVSGISQNLINIKHSTCATIRSTYNSFNAKLNFLVIEKITDNLPNFSFNPSMLNIPDNIKLADNEFSKSKPINALIGANIFYSLLCIGQIKLGKNLPLLQKTQLGWVLAGPLQLYNKPKTEICDFAINDTNIEDQLEMFWRLEECSPVKKYSREEQECEEHFVKTSFRDLNGRFTVRLPTRDNIRELGESKENAIKRFHAVERRLAKDDNLKTHYCNFMNEYIQLGHMSLINDANESTLVHQEPIYYLPHHCVIKDSSSTTKVRVVFDASAATSSGLSLNNVLKVGPTIQEDLVSIMTRFRTYNYVITADIEKMYRMVNVNQLDRNLQRVVWRARPDDELKTYQLNTVTYGTAAAPFLAIRALHQVAFENSNMFPEACQIILRDFYVDDLIFGTSTVSAAIKLKNQISNILSSAGFLLRKWMSNSKDILQFNENSEHLPQFFILNDTNVKTLGIYWDPSSDQLNYSINISKDTISKITKRSILAVISTIFDPLGLIGPVTIRAKLLLQEIWKQKLAWDESVPPNIFTSFTIFYKQLLKVNEINIPRHVLLKNTIDITIHAFCDASQLAYGACIYLVSRDQEENYSSNLLCAKSRVAPLKSITLPRLELCGAQLAAQLVKKVKAALNLSISNIYLWTDSTIVLSWLHIEPTNLKTFVSNRVSEILSTTQIENWNHVRSNENPADIISRGMSPSDLQKCNIWWSGPYWLSLDYSQWPQQVKVKKCADIPEMKKNISLNFVTTTKFDILERYSSLTKLQHVIAYCMRFIKNTTTNKNDKILGSLSVAELNSALKMIVRIAQAQDFATDIHDIQTCNSVKSKSRLSSLDPFLDNGILRVGGRLKNSKIITYDHKHPLVLSNKSPLTSLIINYEHNRLLHAGPQIVLASLRSQYWILNGRNTVRGILRKCITCFKANPKITNPKMGNLPSARVNISRPFSTIGIDFAGPFLVKDGKTRSRKLVKCYLCVFVCFSTKAVHLELISDMTLNSFLNGFKRFCSRRGMPSQIYSDNGTNFKAAANEFQKLNNMFNDTCNSKEFQGHLTHNNIKWSFIPPRSPHFGGLWEACVKSAKFHLKRILGNAHLTFEELYTIIVQIESVLNSRPITPLTDDPNDLEPLTPSHFLIGDILSSVPQHNVSEVPVNRLTNYQRLQQMIQHFWSRWKKEYLSSLQQRFKWKKSTPSELKVGMMVLLKEDGVPPLQWQIGRITEVHPGDDHRVRVVTVKTCKGTLQRSFPRVCPLPMEV